MYNTLYKRTYIKNGSHGSLERKGVEGEEGVESFVGVAIDPRI